MNYLLDSMNYPALMVVLGLFTLPTLLLFWRTRKETRFGSCVPKIIVLAFGMGMVYGFLNHPDQEPNTAVRYFEMSAIYVLTTGGIVT